ncbi:MAG: sugar ABC transporter substrate-binding protein [Eubacteriales bacterium]|nr:sugar ABC transporter substrate-binding protein [Eubacteriales bacterium]
MKRRFTLLLAILLITSLVAAGCGGTTPAPTTAAPTTAAPTEAPTEAPKVFKVGINNFGQANFFARIGKATMEEQIVANGGEVIATVTADVPSRMTAIENMISQGVDAIIIQEGDISQVAPALIEAKAKGILIASMDAGDADFVDVFCESDNDQLGEMAARMMIEFMGGKGNVVEIFNDAGSMIRVRKDAMHRVVEEFPDVKIVAGFTYAWPDFFPDGKAKMEAILQANPNPGDIGGVYATFDGVGLAAAQAIREAGLTDSIVVVGIDGDPEAYIEMAKPDSPFKATMAQDPETMARTVVDQLFELLKGNTIPERHIYIPGVLITKDNIPQ